MSQQQQQEKVRIPKDCPALQAVRAAKGVADCNRRYASLLTAAFEASDMWCDLTQDGTLQIPPQLAEFATTMRLLREDLRFAQEDLLIEWTTRTADAAHSTLVSVHQMNCPSRKQTPESDTDCMCSGVPVETPSADSPCETEPAETAELIEAPDEPQELPAQVQRHTGNSKY